MPVDFLNERQKRSYGRFDGEPSVEELAGCFHFDDTDRALIAKRRGIHNRIGFALQLGTVRFLGTFLENPTEVPRSAIDYVAAELGIDNVSSLAKYGTSETRWDHKEEIRQCFGYRQFNTPSHIIGFIRWLYTRSWLNGERPSVLFDLATTRLIQAKVLLPGISVLTRLIAKTRNRTSERLWNNLAGLPSAEQKTRLKSLLLVPEDSHQSNLDRLRQAPTRVSGPALIKAIERVKEIKAIGVGNIDLSAIPQNRLKALARYAACASAQTISRMTENRKIATLLAFSNVFSTTAMDDALEVFDLMVSEVRSDAEKIGKRDRLRTIGDLDAAALKLLKVCDIVLDEACPPGEVKQRALEHVSRKQLEVASRTVVELARPPGHNYRKEFVDSYRRVRIFLPTLLNNVFFDAAPAGRDTLKAIQFLASIEGQRKPNMLKAPLEIVTPAWKSLVVGSDGIINRQAYTLCVLERLQNDLRRRDIFVAESDRWSDPRSKLLAGERWLAVKAQVCRAVGRKETPEDELSILAQELNESYCRVAANLPSNKDIRIDRKNGKDTLTITNLDRIEEPESLVALREDVKAMLPIVDLPQMLLEIHARTGFANHFTHGSESGARVAKLPVSICAVLLAEACNFGLEPLIREDVPALTRSRLLWVQQNYIRAETLSAANAVLVDTQAQIPLVKTWGSGEVASADGLRFVVPVRTINARPNPKYFRSKRGITWYELTSDQYTGLNGIVIPGTLRDSMYILEVLLGQETSLHPREIMTDTAGASDVVFALFWLLGYRFSPRLADAGEARFWRMDTKADYGILNDLARQPINTKLITRNWEDILRIMGSLLYGTITASELIHTLLRGKRPSTLTRAIQELGRIQRTLYLLNYVDDPDYRRRILTQLNRGEERWGVARTICFARRGEIRKRYREGQEDQLSALGFVLNASVLWQTLYMDQAVQALRNSGRELRPEDEARLSPLLHSNLNVLGSYSFDLTPEVEKGGFRPLRQLKQKG